MTFNKKNILMHKIHYWLSLDINFIISVLSCAVYKSDYTIIPTMLFIVVISILLEVLRVSIDMDDNTNKIVFDYLCVFILSCLMVYHTYIVTSLKVAIIPVIAIIIEFLMIFVIIYPYKIRNKIIKIFKKKRSK